MPATQRPTLSVGVLVRDGCDHLQATFQSVRPVADEILVAGAGSAEADDWIGPARRQGVLVVEGTWDDDFSALRNRVMRQATGDWILWLEAGETLSLETAAVLRAFVNEVAHPTRAYSLLVQVPTEPGERHVSAEQAARIRLLPGHRDLLYEGRLCERIGPSLLAAGVSVEALEFTVQRSRANLAPQVRAERAQRNLRIGAREMAEKGPRADLLVAMGEAHLQLHDRDEAAKTFRQAVELGPHAGTEMLEAYYGLLTAYEEGCEPAEVQVDTCLEALDVFPLDAQLLSAMGGYLAKQNQLDLAARSYEVAVHYGQVDPAAWHLADVAQLAVVSLSLCRQLLAEDDQARSVLVEFLQSRPEAVRVRRHLIELCIKQGDSAAALAEFDLLPASLPGREAFRGAVRGGVLAAQKNWQAAVSYLETAFAAGCREPLCLRWLALTHFALGQFDRARPILETWQGQDPDNIEVSSYLKALADRRLDAPAAASLPGRRPASSAPSHRGSGPGEPRQFRIDAPVAGSPGANRTGPVQYEPAPGSGAIDPPAPV